MRCRMFTCFIHHAHQIRCWYCLNVWPYSHAQGGAAQIAQAPPPMLVTFNMRLCLAEIPAFIVDLDSLLAKITCLLSFSEQIVVKWWHCCLFILICVFCFIDLTVKYMLIWVKGWTEGSDSWFSNMTLASTNPITLCYFIFLLQKTIIEDNFWDSTNSWLQHFRYLLMRLIISDFIFSPEQLLSLGDNT